MNDSSSEQTSEEANSPSSVASIDPLKQQMLLQSLRENQQLARGISFGILASFAGAFLWAFITVITDYQIGWMAVGVGFVVAYVIRTIGKGIDPVFGYWSAGLSLFGCILGNILTVAVAISKHQQLSFATVLFTLLSQPSILFKVLQETFQPLDLLFYGLAVYYGYKYAFRTLTKEELNSITMQS